MYVIIEIHFLEGEGLCVYYSGTVLFNEMAAAF
jgi:hypothetical protein